VKKEVVIRITISITLFSIFVYIIGFGKIINALSHINLLLFITALLIENIGVFVSAKRWQILLKSKKIKLNYFNALSYYYMGSFFNVMMPSSFGGDVIKAYKLGKKTNSIESFSSVIMDRIAGLIAVILIASIGILLSYSILPEFAILIAVIVMLSFLIFLFVLIKTTIIEKITATLFYKWEKIRSFIINVIKSVKEYRNEKIFLPVMLLSLLYHVMLIFNNYVLSLSLGLKINFIYFFIFIPISQILVSLPISIQGFGVRESSYAILFSSVSKSYASFFSLGFLDQIVKVITSLIGGVTYVIKK